MSNGFLSIDPVKDPANNWRNAIGVASLVIGIGLVVSWQFFGKKFDTLELNKLSALTPQLSGAVGLVSAEGGGGDITVSKPEIVKPNLPELLGELPSPETFTAKSIIVKDQKTGAVLYHKNEYEHRSIASLTKLMSALIILEKSPDWLATTTVVTDDISDTHMYAGDTHTLAEFWESALVGSSNKAIMTLADAVGWPRVVFVERMNQKARELGMSDTTFVEPTGLDENNLSTASDLAILLSEAVRNEKISQELLTKEQSLYSKERGEKHHLWNTNWLLLGWIPSDFTGFIGKTGYTVAAGYNFVTRLTAADGRILDVVVLGADKHEARFTEARDVAKAVLENYHWKD